MHLKKLYILENNRNFVRKYRDCGEIQ